MIHIVNNFLPKPIEDSIEQLMFDQNFPWFFNPQTVYEDLNQGYFFNDKNTVSGSQFNHTFLTDYKVNSDLCKELAPLMFHFSLASGVKVSNPIRIKANLTTPDILYADNLHRPAHYDTLDSNITTAIYYVNDADGDTIFFEDPSIKESNEVEELKEIKRVSPKKGQIVYFKSNILHANALCKDTKYRCVINFNFNQ